MHGEKLGRKKEHADKRKSLNKTKATVTLCFIKVFAKQIPTQTQMCPSPTAPSLVTHAAASAAPAERDTLLH